MSMPERQRRRLRGRILAVTEAQVGDALSQDATAGDVLLYLEDATFFSEDGGTVEISDDTNLEDIAYIAGAVDFENDTLTVASPLANSYAAGETSVSVYPLRSQIYASVQPTGADDDPITAVVPSNVSAVLGLGTRADDEIEEARMELDHDSGEWILVDVFLPTPPLDH
jgi:hypothetical protein